MKKLKVWILVAALLVPCTLLNAQQSSPSSGSTEIRKPATVEKKHKGLLDLVPIFDVTDAKRGAPLNAHQKLDLALANSTSPFTFAEAAMKAEYYRGTSPQKKIGHGGIGYMKQWGASYLDEFSGSMFHTFLYPVLLHQDPRYYRRGEGNVLNRIAYCFSRVFITRGDNGRTEFNASMILGSATSTFLSTTYYPPRAHSAGIIAGNIGWAVLGDGVSDAFKEFWPDVAHRLRKR